MTSETSESPVTDQMQMTSLQSSSSDETSQKDSSLVSDAPLLALLSKYPRGFASIAEGQAFVKDLQTLRLVPTTLRSKLSEESNKIERTRPARRKAPVKKLSADEILAGL
jgi:hypothetical protein